MRVFNVEFEPWKIKNQPLVLRCQEFLYSRSGTWSTSSDISWWLWLRWRNACMKDRHDNGDTVWRLVRFWLSNVMDGVKGLVTSKVKQVLEEFQLNICEPRCLSFSSVVWDKPPDGWIKLNIEGYCRGNLYSCAGGGIVRDLMGNFKAVFLRKI